MFIEN